MCVSGGAVHNPSPPGKIFPTSKFPDSIIEDIKQIAKDYREKWYFEQQARATRIEKLFW